MINYNEITLEQIDFIDADVICDADKKQVIIQERTDEVE